MDDYEADRCRALNIPLYRIYWDEEDAEAVARVVRRGSYWSAGPEVEEFESELALFVGRRYADTFNSGSTALQALLMSLDLGEGARVVVPSFTFSSSVGSVVLSGYAPSFVDIEDKYLGVDPEKLQGRGVSAVMPTHYGGCPCRIDELRDKAGAGKLALIEDAAESLGASIKGDKVGSFGDAAIFSFSGNKVVTSGEGGVVVTDSKDIHERICAIKSHGSPTVAGPIRSELIKTYVAVGTNWRMSDLTAALALSQFRKLGKLVEIRKKNTKRLTELLGSIRGVETPVEWGDRTSTHQMYTVRLRDKAARDGLMGYLKEEGVTAKVYFDPIHRDEYYATHAKGTRLPVTEDVSSRVLTLPMFPGLTEEEMRYIAEKVGEYLEA